MEWLICPRRLPRMENHRNEQNEVECMPVEPENMTFAIAVMKARNSVSHQVGQFHENAFIFFPIMG